MATLESPETPECRVFREHYNRLVQSIQDPLPLATLLFSEDAIIAVVKEMSVLGLSTLEKNDVLLSAVEKQIQLDPETFHVFVSALNEDPSMQLLVESMQKELLKTPSSARATSSSLPYQGFTQSSGMLQPRGYGDPPPQHLYSGGGGYQLTFTPPHLPQQGFAQPSGMLQPHGYRDPPPRPLHGGGGGYDPISTPAHLPQQGFVQSSGMLQPSGYQTPPPLPLFNGGGDQPTFTPLQLPQQGVATPSSMLQASGYQIPPQNLYSGGWGYDPTTSSQLGFTPPSGTLQPHQYLYSGGGGYQPPFIQPPFIQPPFIQPPFIQLPQQGGVDKPVYPDVDLSTIYDRVVDEEQSETQEEKESLQTLRKSIESKDVDSFHRHLDELEKQLDNNERMKELLDGRGFLAFAAFIGSSQIAEALIQKGVDINAMSSVPEHPDFPVWVRSGLHWAAEEGHVNTVKCLVEKGAKINIKDNQFGWTPLHLAATSGHVDTARLLVDKGADISSKDTGGRTPLDMATAYSNEAVVAYLKRVADLNMLEKSESTGRQQEQRQFAEETDNSPGEEPPAIAENEEESDRKEMNLQLEKLLEKYRHQPTIKHKSLKCLFTGPPRVGKTTLKKRLLKLIKNLITSGVVSPSGGLEKPISVIIGETRECVTVVMESDLDWQPQHDLLDEAQIVLEFIDKSHQSTPTPGSKASPPDLLPHTTAPAMLASAKLAPAKAVPSISDPDQGKAELGTLDDAKKLMQEVLASRKLHSIKDIEKTTTLYFMDTGGQPEFQEIMPIILNGPALHLVFFNLTINLDDTISIRFCHQDGTDSVITYKSSYTGKQMIFQLLSSLYYLSKGLSLDSESAAVLIGTHLDQLKDQEGRGERKVQEINDSLTELFSNAEFLHQAFLTYPKQDEKSTIFTPVNNYSGDEEEIKQLQAFLRQVIDNRFGSVELPSSWLFFHLMLRHRYENSTGVCTLAECRDLAKGCGLDEKDVPQVLRYIHQSLGTILYYEEVQGLNELVICDPNVLFKSIFHLVAVSFGGDEAQHTLTTEIRKTGEISERVLKRIGTQPSSSLLTNEHIIELLKHFKILTEFHSDEKIAYFMPCLLQPDNLSDFSREALQNLCPPSLLVHFDGNYIPLGMFSALVVKLSQSSWEPDQDSRYRNHILFHTDGVFPVELLVHPTYLEFRIRIADYTKENPEEVHQFCMDVRKTVVDTIKLILDLYEHTRKTKFQLGFYCLGSFQADGQPHFSGCLPRQNYTNPKSFLCSKSPRCQEQCRLPPECTIWFEYWTDKKRSRELEHACNSGYTSRTADDSTQLTLMEIQNELREVTAAKWHHLGVQLGIPPPTLSTIECNYPCDARQCMTEVLRWWLQNAPDCSWAKLTESLEAMDGYRVLVEKLRRQHPKLSKVETKKTEDS